MEPGLVSDDARRIDAIDAGLKHLYQRTGTADVNAGPRSVRPGDELVDDPAFERARPAEKEPVALEAFGPPDGFPRLSAVLNSEVPRIAIPVESHFVVDRPLDSHRVVSRVVGHDDKVGPRGHVLEAVERVVER